MAVFNGRSLTKFGGINIGARSGVIRFEDPEIAPSITSGERLIYTNSSNQLIFNNGTSETVIGASGSGVTDWDGLYDNDKTLLIDGGVLTFNVNANTGGLIINHSASGAGAPFQIQNSGTGNDITGPSWSIISTGSVGILELTSGGTINATDGALTIGKTATATTFPGTVVITGTAGSDSLTLTNGDVLLSDASITLTDADNAASFAITNNTASTAVISTITGNGLTTGTGFRVTSSGTITSAAEGLVNIVGTGITTGDALKIDLTEGTLTTGNYIRCYDDTGSVAVFTVAEDGITVIRGAAASDVLTLTNGDMVMSDGSLTITDADNAASFSLTNDTATTASIFAIAGSGAYTGSTTASFVTITPSGLTSGTAAYIVGAGLNTGRLLHLAADDTQSTGVLLYVQSTGANSANTSGRGLLVDHTATAITSTLNKINDWAAFLSTRTVTTGTVADDFDLVSIIKTSVSNDALSAFSETGSVLRIENAVTNTVGTVTSTSKGIEVVMDSLGTGDGVEITHAATGGIALNVIGAATTVDDVLIACTGVKANNKASLQVTNNGATAAGGSILRVINTGTPAAATSYLVDFDYSGATMTNNPVGVYIHGGSSTAQALEVVSTGASANNLGVISATTNGIVAAGGSVLRITSTGTPAAATSYLVDFDYTGATFTNNPDCVYIASAGTGRALHITDSGTVIAATVDIESTNAGALGPILRLSHQGGSQANSDVVGRIQWMGEDDAVADENYGKIEVSVSDVAAANPDSTMEFYIDLAGTQTQRLQVANAINGVVVGASGSTGVISSNGAQSLLLETNNGTSTSTITIASGANSNITIDPAGTGVSIVKAVRNEQTSISGVTTYAIGTDGNIVLVTAAAPYSITLPAAATAGAGYWITFIKTDNNANAITLDGSGAETINSSATYAGIDAQYDFITVISDSSNWYISNVKSTM